MYILKTLIAGAVLVGAMFAAAPASAEVAEVNANVRNAPGGSVVGTLRRGEEVRVIGREGTWCQIGNRRWVACRLLGDSRDDRNIPGGPSNLSFGFSFDIPGFRIEFGEGGFRDRPGRRGGGDRVCFYEHVNYGGDSFCVRPGERLRSLGSWNDRISSIRVRGDAEALVCEHVGFRGRCAVVDRSVRNLGRRGNDIISSIRVR